MRPLYIVWLLVLALALVVLSAIYGQLQFLIGLVWGILSGVILGVLANYLYHIYGTGLAKRSKKLFYFMSVERQRDKIEEDYRRIHKFFDEPQTLKKHTIAACQVVLGHWAFAGILGLAATLPPFVVKIMPVLDQNIPVLNDFIRWAGIFANVFIIWAGMFAYVMFLLGIWHGYRLWSIHHNVFHLAAFDRKCEDRRRKLPPGPSPSRP